MHFRPGAHAGTGAARGCIQGSAGHNATYMKSGPQIVRWFDTVAARH